ncbi:MAG TPA: hypothetical protein QF625_03985 [Candidatus Scalindua sp.]|nr:hypothetical protein [Candidatus Scalindua sp.]
MTGAKSSGSAGRISGNDAKTGERILENIEKNDVMTLGIVVMIDVKSSGNDAKTSARILENTEKGAGMILGTVVRIGAKSPGNAGRTVVMIEQITLVRARDRDRGIKAEGLKVADNWFNIEK